LAATAGAQSQLTDWLRDAIRRGLTGEWVGRFPKYAWRRVGNRVFEARLVNSGNGEYKGYELRSQQWPLGI